ncbi:oligosaccharide repeat unit polymerase [Clostridium perfringens]
MFTKIRQKNTYNPRLLFFLLWAVILILHSLNLFGISACSEKTYLIILIGLIFWWLGSSVSTMVRIKKVSTIDINDKNVKEINKPMFRIITIVTYFILLYAAVQGIIKILAGGSLYNLRYVSEDNVLSNSFLSILYNYFAIPVSYVAIHFYMNKLIFGEMSKGKITCVLEVVFIVVAQILTQGGRFAILYVLIDGILLMMIHKKKQRKSKEERKNLHRLRVVLFLAVAGLLFVTINRGSKLFETMYTYTSGCVSFLDILIQKFSGEYTYGLTSMNGFIRPFFTLLRAFGLISTLPKGLLHVQDMLAMVEFPVWIGDGILYNGFSSFLYDFYVDGGFIGVIIISFIWGVLCQKVYIKFIRLPSEKNTILYLLIMQGILTSMLKFQFVAFHYALAFIYLEIMCIQFRKSR